MRTAQLLESPSPSLTTEEIRNGLVFASPLLTTARESPKKTLPESLSHSSPRREKKAPALACGCAKELCRNTTVPSLSEAWRVRLRAEAFFPCSCPPSTRGRR